MSGKLSVNPSAQDGLVGPGGGAWSRTDAGEAGGRLLCGVCHAFHTRGWQYWVGIVAHAFVCDECAEDA